MHTAFFTDKMHGGREPALAAAQEYCRQLAAKLGTPVQLSRRDWAELRRRKGSSGIVGVQKSVDRRFKHPRIYWKATWSPEPYVVRRKWFSARKYGNAQARQLAIQTRRAGLKSMKPAAPGVPPNYPDAKKLVTADCIQPQFTTYPSYESPNPTPVRQPIPEQAAADAAHFYSAKEEGPPYRTKK